MAGAGPSASVPKDGSHPTTAERSAATSCRSLLLCFGLRPSRRRLVQCHSLLQRPRRMGKGVFQRAVGIARSCQARGDCGARWSPRSAMHRLDRMGCSGAGPDDTRRVGGALRERGMNRCPQQPLVNRKTVTLKPVRRNVPAVTCSFEVSTRVRKSMIGRQNFLRLGYCPQSCKKQGNIDPPSYHSLSSSHLRSIVSA